MGGCFIEAIQEGTYHVHVLSIWDATRCWRKRNRTEDAQLEGNNRLRSVIWRIHVSKHIVEVLLREASARRPMISVLQSRVIHLGVFLRLSH